MYVRCETESVSNLKKNLISTMSSGPDYLSIIFVLLELMTFSVICKLVRRRFSDNIMLISL